MALTKIWDLAYEVDGDTVRVEQDGGMGEACAVDLHVTHVRLLASELGLLNGDGDAWRKVATLERRLRVLYERITELDARLWAVPVYPPGSANDDPDLFYSEATVELAREFVADLPLAVVEPQRMERNGTPANATERQETPSPASQGKVTQAKPKASAKETSGLSDGQGGLPLEPQQ